MNIGNALVSTVLRTGKIRPFIDAGLDKAWLKTPEGRAVIKTEDRQIYLELLDYYAAHKVVNEEAFRADHPASSYRLAEKKWKHSEVVAKIRDGMRRWLLLDILNLAEDLDADLDESVAAVLRQADRLRTGLLRGDQAAGGVETLYVDDIESFLADHIEQGIPFGISEIDQEYGGGQPGQLITFVGRQKSTKSTLLAWAAIAAWQSGYEQVFYNVELDMTFMRQKLFSIGAHVSPTRLRRGPKRDADSAIDPREQDRWEEEKNRVRKFNSSLADDGVAFRIAQKFSRFTVADVARDIDTYHPHAVYIDGFYFMEDADGDGAAANHKAIENIAADLKALAMQKQVCIYVSTQAQEKQQGKKRSPGIEARTIQGGTGLLKASDLVLGIDMDEAGIVYINQIHNRYGQVEPVAIDWDWEVMEMKISDVDYEKFE